MVIPARRLNLDMLAQHIEAETLCHLNIINHRLVRGRREQALTPIALVEQAALEIGLIIEHQARDSLPVPADAAFAHADIGAHRVSQLALRVECKLNIV